MKNTEIIYLYVIERSHNPDKIECVVPFRVNEQEIFFGPCKKRLRKELREKYLSSSCNYNNIDDDIYVIGVNGSNPNKDRKILFIGKITEIMTFEQAYKRLTDVKYHGLKKLPNSPLHVKPIYKENKLIGYEHISDEHKENDEWRWDFVKKSKQYLNFNAEEKTIHSDGSWEAFPRDCCMLMENIFWADKDEKQSHKKTDGLKINKEVISILQEVQNNKVIEDYYIFGKQKNGNAEGLIGRYLKIENKNEHNFATELMDELDKLIKKYK